MRQNFAEMDYVGMSSTVLQLVEMLGKAISKYYERGDISNDNKEQLDRLKRYYGEAANCLRRLEHLSSPDYVTMARLALHHTTLQEDMDKLTKWEQPVDNAKRTNRVKRMKEMLLQCETNVKEFFDFLGDKVSPMLETQPFQHDVYTPRNTVPVNPRRLVLDYKTTATSEGQLKAAVLHEAEGRLVAVVASGKGGVGKTCALRGLADDEDINQRFAGGILYIQLGNDAAVSNIVKGIANIVERTGGTKLANVVGASESLQAASEKASDWFSPHSCLFLLDDIWRVNGIDSNVLSLLGKMVNASSRLVYTTRDRHFLGRADRMIEFEEKETHGELARRMLLKHSGFREEEELDKNNKDAFEAILDMCQGLPLAFGIVGAAVLKNSRRKCSERQQNSWTEFYQDVLSNQETIFEISAEEYGPLSKIVDVSLKVLEMQNKHERYSDRFRAFCVLQKQQSVCVEVLQKLWNMDSLDEVKQVVYTFEEVSLVQVRREGSFIFVRLHDLILDLAVRKASKRLESQKIFQTLIHNYIPIDQRNDQQHDWWNYEDDGYLYNNLCRVLRSAGYVDKLLWLLSKPQWIVKRLVSNGIYSVEHDVGHGLAIADDRAFGHSNRREHLETVKKAARMSCTFVANNPREVWFQLHGRLLRHAARCELTKRFVEEIEEYAPRPWAKASLGLLQAPGLAVEMIRSPDHVRCISVEQDDVWFLWSGHPARYQVGVSCYNSTTGICKTQRFLLEDQNREWIEDIHCSGFLGDGNCVVTAHENKKIAIWNRETGKMKQIVNCRYNSVLGAILKRCLGRDFGVEGFIAFSCDGRRVASTASNHTIQVWDTLSGKAVGAPLVGHKDTVLCAAFSSDGSRIVSGSEDQTVRVWNAQTGKTLAQSLIGHTDWVTCVAINKEGNRILSGSRDQTVRVWDAHSGEAKQVLDGHGLSVECVAVTGSCIVTGSKDNTVRIWDTCSGEALAKPLTGHTRSVLCVDVSKDGKRVVSGSKDKTVRVWDTNNGEIVAKPLVGHTGTVRSVAVSEDGNRIVSGSLDRTLRVWDARSGEAVCGPLVGHTDWVLCVAVSKDGSRIVSGSEDRTVRVWDGCRGEPITPPLVGHTHRVACVALSADGTRVVSGSWDESVRVWDAHDGNVVGVPLAHGEAVVRVGVDAQCSRIVSFDWDDIGRLWDVSGGECVLTSRDAAWWPTVDELELCWSSPPQIWKPTRALVSDGAHIGRQELVLGTFEEPMENVNGGDVYFSYFFERRCTIVR